MQTALAFGVAIWALVILATLATSTQAGPTHCAGTGVFSRIDDVLAVMTECPSRCRPYDFDNDGAVSFQDVYVAKRAWNECRDPVGVCR